MCFQVDYLSSLKCVHQNLPEHEFKSFNVFVLFVCFLSNQVAVQRDFFLIK